MCKQKWSSGMKDLPGCSVEVYTVLENGIMIYAVCPLVQGFPAAIPSPPPPSQGKAPENFLGQVRRLPCR